MKPTTKLALFATAALAAGCQTADLPVENGTPDVKPSLIVLPPIPPDGLANFEQFEVCKFGTTTTFNFSVTDRSTGAVTPGTITLNDGQCRVIAAFGGLGADVSVTEVVPTGWQLDRVDIDVITGTPPAPVHTLRTESGPTVTDFISGTAGGGLRGVLAEYFNSRPTGGEGCTPGYWKQPQHFDSWPAGISPTDLFSLYFEDAFPGLTLLEVLSQGGGKLIALGRHTVAAFLNASSPGVNYALTPAQVIAEFNAVFPSLNYGPQKDRFEAFNESGCPLN